MVEAFSQMLWPLLASLVLVGIHAYLGIHVIKRKVIFVDLALAQIAALGAVYAVLLGLSFEADALAIKLVAIAFTLVGALLCSFTKVFETKVPHEAIIGIIYAAALSTTFLLTAHLPHGSEEISQMLTGNILWVTPKEVIVTAGLYALIGLLHILFRKQFFAAKSGFWDFLFYALFGIVVTSSVGMGGVLLVFGYLVIPSVIGIMLATSIKNRLLVAWATGVLMSIFGIITSYHWDLPSGPAIVVLLALLLALIMLGNLIFYPKTRAKGFIAASFGLFFLCIVFVLPFYFPTHAHEQESLTLGEQLSSADAEVVHKALSIIKQQKPANLPDEALLLLKSRDDKIRSSIIEVIKVGGYPLEVALKKAFAVEGDDFIKIELAEALLSLGDRFGLKLLSELAQHAKTDLAKDDARLELYKWIKTSLKGEALFKFIDKNYGQIFFDKDSSRYLFRK